VRDAKRDRVPLREIVEEAWTLVSLDRQARAVRFVDEVDPAQHVAGDADRLTQVFVNLLRNAVDALDTGRPGPGGPPVVGVRAGIIEQDARRWARIVVFDNGPGLDPGVLPRLFEPFTSTRLDSHGTGLGLAVAEGIVKEHGGVIIARNAAAPNRGAEFELVLPIEAPSTPTAHRDPAPEAPIADRP
jgi:signal transduction histidine kinase